MSYSSRIMNIPPVRVGDSDGMKIYRIGHRDARHAAAEIASEAEGEVLTQSIVIENLEDRLDAIRGAIPVYYLLDPPDGGDVSTVEGVQHLVDDMERLRGGLDATQSLLDRAMTLIPEPEDLEYLVTLARNAPHKTRGEEKLIEKFERLLEKL